MAAVNDKPITLENLYERIVEADKLKSPSQSASHVAWNDAYFNKKYVDEITFNKRPIPSHAILYAKSFLNWYVFNSLPVNVGDTVLGLLSSIPLDESHYLINDHFFKSTHVNSLTAPGDAEKVTDKEWVTKCQGAPIPSTTGIASGSGISASQSVVKVSIQRSDATDWYNSLWDMLSIAPVENKYDVKVYQAIVYLGYICLQLLRVVVKEPMSVAIHILKYTNERLNKLFTYTNDLKITLPPHDGMLERFVSMYVRFQPGSINALTMVIYSHVNPPANSKDIVEVIFRSAGLLALSQVGLGCLGWLSRAADNTKVPMSVLLKYMAVTKHETMILSIIQFIHTIGSKPTERTWPWARLFTDGAYQELSVRSDPMFGMIMMVVATGASMDSEMWTADQFKNYSGTYEKKKAPHDYGHTILKLIYKVDEETCKTDEARKMAREMSFDRIAEHGCVYMYIIYRESITHEPFKFHYKNRKKKIQYDSELIIYIRYPRCLPKADRKFK